jgi:hypothetical protein
MHLRCTLPVCPLPLPVVSRTAAFLCWWRFQLHVDLLCHRLAADIFNCRAPPLRGYVLAPTIRSGFATLGDPGCPTPRKYAVFDLTQDATFAF